MQILVSWSGVGSKARAQGDAVHVSVEKPPGFRLSLGSNDIRTWTYPGPWETVLFAVERRKEMEPGMVGYATMPIILAEAGALQ